MTFVPPRISDAAWDRIPAPVTDALDPDSDILGGGFNEHGDYEQTQVDGRLVVVHWNTEGVICEWFVNGEPDDIWAETWDELT